MAKRIKVALLLEDLLFGGTQRQAIELARRMDPERFDVTLWVLLGGSDFDPIVQENGTRLIRFSHGSALGPGTLIKLWRKLAQERVDALVLLTALPNIWGRVVSRIPGSFTRPLLLGNIRQSGAPQRYHEKWLWRLADHHVCNASALKKQLCAPPYSMPPERVTVILNGVDVDRFTPPPNAGDRKPLFLAVGRLIPDKDHTTLIRAFDIVAGRHAHAQLRIVGDGPLESDLKQQVAELAPERAKRIQILPARLDLAPQYREAGCFVLSSLKEGLPNVVMEAMATGTPVVSTAVDGAPELVEEGRTGLLVQPRDVQGMAKAMLRVIENRELAGAMGAAARKRAVDEFSFERMARLHEELILKLASSDMGGDRA